MKWPISSPFASLIMGRSFNPLVGSEPGPEWCVSPSGTWPQGMPFFWFDRVCFFFGQWTRKHQTNPHLDLLHSWFSSIHILYIITYIYPVCPDDFLRFFWIDGGLSRGHRISVRCVHECLDGAWAICGAISTAKIRCFPIFARGSTWQKRGSNYSLQSIQK